MLGDVMRGSIGVQIWTLCVMSDSTVVSGDSRGQVQLWDGTAGVLMVTFRQHSADVLALVVSPGERDIFASGVDGKVVCLQRPQSADGGAASSTWIYVHAHRAHSHDVFSLVVVPVRRAGSGSDDQLVLLSGGVEGRLSTYAVDSFVRVRPTWIPAIPTQSLTSCSHNREAIAVRHSEYVDVWQLQYMHVTDPSSDALATAAPTVVAADTDCQLYTRLLLKGDHNIHCCGLSASGDVIALSSASGLRVYQLAAIGKDAAQEKKILVPSVINSPGELVQAVAFVDRCVVSPHSHPSPKKKRKVVSKVTTFMAVYCAKKGSIYMCGLSALCAPDIDSTASGASVEERLCSVRSELNHHLSVQTLSRDPLCQAVRKMVFSGPGDYLAVLSCGSVSGVFVYAVDKMQLHWVLPTDAQLVTDMTFLCRSSAAPETESHVEEELSHSSANHAAPSKEGVDPSSLVCITASNSFHVFDIDQLKLGPEYRVPRSVRDMASPICGVSVLDHRMIMYGQGYCVFVDLSQPVEGSSGRDPLLLLAPGDASSKLWQSSLKMKNKKQRRAYLLDEQGGDEHEAEGKGARFVVFNKYRNLLQVAFKSSNELVRAHLLR